MLNFWNFFIKKSVFSYLTMGVLIIAGLFSVITLPKESNPEVTVPIGGVSVGLPNASAADVEKLITNKLEEQLINNLDNVTDVTSTSAEGGASVVVQFDPSADIPKSIQDLKDEVDVVKPDLPDEATDPNIFEIDFNSDPILTFAISSDLPEKVFVSIAKSLEDELKSIRGVSDVSISGLRDREVQVIVKKEVLSQFGLNITDVISSISATNSTLPAGNITIDDIKYNVQFEGDINDPSEIADIAILSREGQPIYVRDVATVIDGFEERSTVSRISIEGEPSQSSFTFNVFKRTGGDITEITSAVHNRLEELKQPGELLEGLETLVIFDTGELLLEDLRTLSITGIQTVILVMLVLFVAIGWRESLIAGSAIPLSFLIAFIGLLASGNTLNFVSLFSLILAIGVLVDTGIVIVEGINTRLASYGNGIDAAKATVKEFYSPLTSGTMTTVAVFAPLFFISGISGEFIKSIPFTVISVLLASLLVALGFLPLLASRFLKDQHGKDKLCMKQDLYTEKLQNWYTTKLHTILGNRKRENYFLATVGAGIFFALSLPIKGLFLGLIAAVLMGFIVYIAADNTHYIVMRVLAGILIVVAALGNLASLFLSPESISIPGVIITLIVTAFLIWVFYLFMKAKDKWYLRLTTVLTGIVLFVVAAVVAPSSAGQVPVTFFDAGDEEFLIVEIELPEGTILSSTDLETRKVEELLYEVPEIEAFTITSGAGSSFTDGGSGSKLANAFLLLRDDRNKTSKEILNDLRETFSVIDTATVRVTQLSSGPPVGTPVVVSFLGDDLAELEEVAEQSADILRSIPGTADIVTSTKDDGTEFVLTIDKAKATSLGLNSALVSQTLRAAVSGLDATVINNIEDDIDVRVVLDLNPNYLTPHDTSRVNIDAIRQLEIQTQNGPILLGSVLNADIQKSKTVISHEEGKRRSTVGSELGEGGNTREIVAAFVAEIEEQEILPTGVEMVVGGENQENDESFRDMGIAFIVGVILMFAILVLQFNSLRFPLFILSVIPSSFLGIFLGLLITGQSLSFPSLMGLIALSGIVVNNAIILIDTINNKRRENGSKLEEVIVAGSKARLRPILLTSITTIIGIAPLTLASALWAPLAWAVIFGLLVTAATTLVLVPVLYRRRPGKLS